MPVTPMAKVAILGHQEEKNLLLSQLQKFGLLQLTPVEALTPSPASKDNQLEIQLGELEAAIILLTKLADQKKSFIESFAPYKEAVSSARLAEAYQNSGWQEKLAAIKKLESEEANLNNLVHNLKSEIALLSPWEELSCQLDQLNCTNKTCVVSGALKSKQLPLLKRLLAEELPAAALETVAVKKDKSWILIFYLAPEGKVLEPLLSRVGLEKIALPSAPATPRAELERLRGALVEAENARKELTAKLKSFIPALPELTYVYDYLFQQLLLQNAADQAGQTKRVFMLNGWVPADQVDRLAGQLKKLTPLVEVLTLAPEATEKPPTLLTNKKVFYPFELITRIFGLPSREEIDPTGPLSFFYLLFFAMCLSDVGYGLLLTIAAYYYLRKLTLTEGGKKLLLLLFWGGIATMVIGVMTGGYFGIDLNTLPPSYGNFLKSCQLIDPIKSPLNVLILSLGLGVIQNLFGVFLSMYWKIKGKKYLDALLDDGLWLYYLIVLVSWGGLATLGHPATPLFFRLTLAGAVLLVLTQGRKEDNLIKKAISGILSLYKTTAYLGDTLSYSRLLALMMTTGIIGMVVNIIALLTRDSIPVLGYFLMTAILIVGHLFNLVVSVLGAFIHAARLQLVEFFGKFYEGSGREFRPFCREPKYVIIND